MYQDYSFAIVNYEHTAMNKNFTLFLVYDQRVNNQLEKISRQLFQDLLIEESSIFIEIC